jgi:hypothetical protein
VNGFIDTNAEKLTQRARNLLSDGDLERGFSESYGIEA